MESNDRVLISAIYDYCTTLVDAIRDYSIDRTVLMENQAFRGMAAFFVQQIGECSKKLSPSFTSSHPEIEWRAISGMRNRIAHNYGKVDAEILWDVVEHDIPELTAFCSKVLANNSNQSNLVA